MKRNMIDTRGSESDLEISTEKWFDSDMEFNALYPLSIQALAKRHWTPLSIARKAANFLAAGGNVRILDIGSGVGKFCLAAAHYSPKATYFGVEQRQSLINYANAANQQLQLDNVAFIHGNFTQLDLKKYDHFYFYNAFYENLNGTDKIDDSIDYSGELYNYYNRYLYRQLQQSPAGTRVCSLCSLDDEMPRDFLLTTSNVNELLKCWIKT
jgi:SAM-dependent methyltransferase